MWMPDENGDVYLDPSEEAKLKRRELDKVVDEMLYRLPTLKKAADEALTKCKEDHLNKVASYNMIPSASGVVDVGLKISIDGDCTFYVEIDDANCDKLSSAVYNLILKSTGLEANVTNEW